MDRSAEELTTFISRFQQQQQKIFEQAKELNLTRESMEETLRDHCRSIAEIMQAERVSIWLFNEDQTTLTERITYAADSIEIPVVRELKSQSASLYFEKVASQRVSPVEDIASDPALQSLPNEYFDHTSIASLIDASIIMSRGIGGILCCETINKREWSKLDEVIMAANADMLSFVFDRLTRIEMENQVHELAYTDVITGIDNENAFIEKVNERLVSKDDGFLGAFIYMKVDQFAAVQSVMGPAASRYILKELAKRFHYLFPPDSIIARIAFDHFIIFTEHGGDLEENRRTMMEIVQKLREPIVYEGQEVLLTFSYGIALFPDHVRTAYSGIQAAKTALDSSQKNTARKTRAVYNPKMYQQWEEAMQSEMNLEKGLYLNEFCLYYQPQVESGTYQVTGAEALIRWRHPERGILSPADFITIAETTGLISQIGEWVVRQACEQLKKWEEEGLGHLTISVNISPRHFLYEGFPNFLAACAKEYGIQPAKLVIEITENIAFEDEEIVETHIQELKKIGFPVSIDDFGTGYSAFIYLQKFSIQEVKIDRQFVENIDTDIRSRAIVRAILTLAQSLKMHTVAEGVETLSQLTHLERLGCLEIQGYYFSRPVPIEVLTQWFQQSSTFPQLYLPNSSK